MRELTLAQLWWLSRQIYFTILGTLLRMGSWRIVSYLLSNLPEKFFQKSHGGRAESLAAALEGSLGQVSPF